jgi:hypothetical protein
MKKLLTVLAIIAISTTSMFGLAPFKVGVYYTGAAATMNVQITDYSAGTNILFTSDDITNVTGNDFGFAILDIVDNGASDLDEIAPEDINTSTVIEILINNQVYAQYRLDQLLQTQASGGAFDSDGNLSPPENGIADLGTDEKRWVSAYVLGSSVHIGPADGEANETEMKLSYTEAVGATPGTGTIKGDTKEIVDITEDKVTVDGETEITGKLTASAIENIIGDGSDNTHLTINGSSTNAATKDLIVNGDVQINGSLTVDGTVAQTPIGTTIGALASVIILDGDGTLNNWTQNDLHAEHSIGSIVHIYQSNDNFNTAATPIKQPVTLTLNGVSNDLSDERDSYIITKTEDDGAGNTTWIFISENNK